MENKMVLAVVDTNVLVSGLLSRNGESAVVRVFEALMAHKITPVISDEIIKEYNEVLHRIKFRFPSELVDSVISEIISKGVKAERIHTNETIPDPKDVVFYEVALSKEGSYLVTGNIKHFPRKPIVVTPAEFLDIIKDV